MSGTRVITWYATGEEKPWRAEWFTEGDYQRALYSCDTFRELLLVLGDIWSRVMPDPFEDLAGIR
jgi:hypothetical protein